MVRWMVWFIVLSAFQITTSEMTETLKPGWPPTMAIVIQPLFSMSEATRSFPKQFQKLCKQKNSP